MDVITKLTPEQERWIPEIQWRSRREQADRATPIEPEQVRP